MIIGFAGKAASGKTTAAQHLQSVLDKEVVILPMAKVLRDEVENFLRRCGAGEFVPLLYGSQKDKVTIFYLDEKRAMAECKKWTHYLQTHHDIQDRALMTAVTTRRILQWWGTEYRRAEDPDYWTKAWSREVEKIDFKGIHVLVDDVRFVNELKVIRSHGGLVIKIVRPGFDGANNHSSEVSLDHITDWSAIVINDGSLDQFFEKIDCLVKKLKL